MKWLAAAAALSLALAGCGSSDDEGGGGGSASSAKPKASAPGITETTVTVGGHFPLTGPAAPGYSEIPRAIDAYFQHVNANGGVHGRKLKMIIRDDGYNPVNTVKVTKQLVLQDKVFAILGGLGTPTHTKVIDYLNAAKVPDIFVVQRLPLLGRPGQAPVHVRLAAGLPDRGQDPRPLHRRELQGQEGRLLRPERRLRIRRRGRAGHVCAQGAGRDAADL